MSLLSILAAITGCRSIPLVSAEKLTYKSAHPFGGSTITTQGVHVTDERIEIDHYERDSNWGWMGVTAVSQNVTITKYARDRKPGEEAKIDAP